MIPLTKRLCIPLLAVGIIIEPAALAQGVDDKKNKRSPIAAHLSIIALGGVPSRKYKMPDSDEIEKILSRKNESGKSEGNEDDPESGKKGAGSEGSGDAGVDKIPILLDPAPGTVPPPSLFYRAPKARDGNPWSRMRVGFNNATAIGLVPAGIPLALHTASRDAQSGFKTYITMPPLKPATQSILFLTPEGSSGQPWSKKPKLSILNIESQALADKHIIVRNFSSRPVAFKLDDEEPLVLSSGQRRSMRMDKEASFNRVLAADVNSRQALMNTVLRLRNSTLNIFAFYDANEKTNGGKKIGVFRTTVDRLGSSDLNQPIVPDEPE